MTDIDDAFAAGFAEGKARAALTEQEYDAIQRLLFDAISRLRQADSAVATARDMLCDWRARP